MSKHLVALTVTTLLGMAVGGFVLWKGIQRRRSKASRVTQQQLSQQQPKVPGRRERPAPAEDQQHSSAPRASWEERIDRMPGWIVTELSWTVGHPAGGRKLLSGVLKKYTHWNWYQNCRNKLLIHTMWVKLRCFMLSERRVKRLRTIWFHWYDILAKAKL